MRSTDLESKKIEHKRFHISSPNYDERQQAGGRAEKFSGAYTSDPCP